jgi:hypothetical protein
VAILLLDDTLQIEVFHEPADSDLSDNICVCITEDCPDEERLLRNEQTRIFITAQQARELAGALLDAAERSLTQGMD